MKEAPTIPRGGGDLRKNAAITLALGVTRGALIDALAGDLYRAKDVLNATSLSKLAETLGCSEEELAIDWNDYLTPSEIAQIRST